MGERIYSAQQVAIFNWFKKSSAAQKSNLVVRARAGTGKTTTILEALNYAPEGRILLAAFNKRIAEELATRLTNPKAQAKTLHSLGFGFVQSNWTGSKLDAKRGDRMVKLATGGAIPPPLATLARRLASLGKNVCPFPKPGELVQLAAEFELLPDEQWAQQGWDAERLEGVAVKAMDLAATTKDGTIDYDDMVYVPVKNRWVVARYDMVVVDECQDMNAAQIMMARATCRKGGRVVVVGDDCQAIYGFRGADSGSLDRLKSELSADELGLTVTYRCAKSVVAVAAQLVEGFEAGPDAPEGTVTDLDQGKLTLQAEVGDFILSRKNAPLAKVCLQLLRNGKRAKIEGKDLGQSLLALITKLKATSITDFLDRLGEWQQTQSERVSRGVDEETAAKRVEEVEDKAGTLRALAEGAANVQELTGRVQDLFVETERGRADFIVCSSVHKAKGLEADTVYVLTGTFYPGRKKFPYSAKRLQEEKNIEYVAVTRAKRHLVRVGGTW